MQRKRTNWVAHWRKFKGFDQAKLAERLAEYAERHPGEDIPTTAASLSRIETGKQNFRMSFLEAVAEILSEEGDLVTPADLLGRNPFAGTAKIINLIDQLDEEQQRKAVQVLDAIFGESRKAR